MLKAAIRLRQQPILDRMLVTARRKLRVELSELDRDPTLAGVLGGVVDLRSGQGRTGTSQDWITMSTRIAFDPAATCPRFEAFLDRITGGKGERARFIQSAAGYSLTGDTSDRCFFLLHGSGCNGKTTLLDILRGVCGDYAGTISSSAFLLNPNSSTIPNDLAALRGKRLVTCSELPEGKWLDENVIKKMTGQDPLTVRFLHQEWFDYKPNFKLWVATNSLPHVRETKRAIWDRIRLIPFEVEIPENEVRRNLAVEILASEGPGVLAWMVRGAVMWHQRGLEPPDDVVEAAKAYRSREDVVADYLRERTDLDSSAPMTKQALYQDYCAWAAPDKPMSKRAFAERVADHGIKSGWIGKQKAWEGIKFAT